MPLSVVDCNNPSQSENALSEAAIALAERGLIGIVWLDADQRVEVSAGSVPFPVSPGQRIADAILPLFALDDEIEALKVSSTKRSLRIPNAAVISADSQSSPRMSLTVVWFAERRRYLVIMGTVLSHGQTTTELDQEIRRRRRIEQDLADKSYEYERINQQLEQFAYVISHDLNAPMRALRYLSADISAAIDGPNAASADAQHAIKAASSAIADQTRRMSRMLTDLLDYARIGKVQEALEHVDTHALIVEIIASLRPTSALTLSIGGEWPTLETVRTPLAIVLRNLVENAIKHHDRAEGSVTVEAVPGLRDVVFKVSDDGRGIPAEWQSAIFEPFRKIDDAHHPESSGIGLALVRQTILSLGGTIAVQSDAPARRGTTFVVRWPRRPAIPN